MCLILPQMIFFVFIITSYFWALNTATEFVKPVSDSFDKSFTDFHFGSLPGVKMKCYYWRFAYSYHLSYVFDVEFWVCVSPLGNILVTNPTNLHETINNPKVTSKFVKREEARTSELQNELHSIGWPEYLLDTEDIVSIDSYILSFGLVDDWLDQKIRKLLKPKRINFKIIAKTHGPQYSITINDTQYTILNKQELEELEHNRDLEEHHLLCAHRCFSIVNSLLEKAGSSDRFYIIGKGIYSYGVILSPKDTEKILKLFKDYDDLKPYIPLEKAKQLEAKK